MCKDQMGLSSIQIAVDAYCHLISGADMAWADRWDSKTTLHQSAPGTHQEQNQSERDVAQRGKYLVAPQGFEPR
jgi:hypothetical protein